MRRALAVASLQHEELAVFNGELDVLHVLVVLLELRSNLHQMRERLWKVARHLRDRFWCTDTRDDIFALRVHKEIAVEHILARGVVARERNASARVVAHVAVCHRLHIDRCAVETLDAFDAAIHDRLVTVP